MLFLFRFRLCCFTWNCIFCIFCDIFPVVADRRATARTTELFRHVASWPDQKKKVTDGHDAIDRLYAQVFDLWSNSRSALISVRKFDECFLQFNWKVGSPSFHLFCWLKAAPAIFVARKQRTATKSYPKSRSQKVYQFPCVHLLIVSMLLMSWRLAFCMHISSLLCLVVFPLILVDLFAWMLALSLLLLTLHHCQNTPFELTEENCRA